MPRTLSSTLATVKDTNLAHTHLLLDLVAGARDAAASRCGSPESGAIGGIGALLFKARGPIVQSPFARESAFH